MADGRRWNTRSEIADLWFVMAAERTRQGEVAGAAAALQNSLWIREFEADSVAASLGMMRDQIARAPDPAFTTLVLGVYLGVLEDDS